MESNHIQVSDSALGRLEGMLASKDAFVRLAVTAGGCSGLLYRLSIDDKPRNDDVTLFQDEPVKIVAADFKGGNAPDRVLDPDPA